MATVLSKDLKDYWLSAVQTGSYDITKTGVYSVVLVITSYVIYRTLKVLKFRIDRRLAVAIAPYVVFGSCLRVLKDAGILQSFIFVTPGIWFFIFSVVMTALAVSQLINRLLDIDYYKTMFVLGIMLLPFVLAELEFVNASAVLIVIALIVPWLLLISFVEWPAANKYATLLHMYDATTTFVAMSFFGYSEQHVIPNYFIANFGIISFVVIKLVTLVTILWFIDRSYTEENDQEFKFYIKLIIGILGSATGTRGLITLASGV